MNFFHEVPVEVWRTGSFMYIHQLIMKQSSSCLIYVPEKVSRKGYDLIAVVSSASARRRAVQLRIREVPQSSFILESPAQRQR